MNPVRFGVILLLRFYGVILSPLKNAVMGVTGSCRYFPTCSTYALEAVERHGVACGGALAVKRICRCHPWGGSGIDRVPESPRIFS